VRQLALSTHSSEQKLLYKIAKAYYQDDLTQNQVGQRFGLSRVKISRLLQQARDEGIVQIAIISPPGSNADLERRLEARYGLDEAVVVSPSGYDQATIVREVGQAAADCLIRGLQGHEVIGLSWGTTLASVVDALPPRSWPGVTVVQIAGGLGRPEVEFYGSDLTRRVGQVLGGKSLMIRAPGIVANRVVRDALLADTHIAETLGLAARADVALVGIGALTSDSVVMRASSLLTAEQIEQLKALGMVGNIALRFYDAHGRPIHHEVNDRMIALDLEQIRRIPRVIAAAGGADKFESIRAALRGSLINVLVTDDKTGAWLLQGGDESPAEAVGYINEALRAGSGGMPRGTAQRAS
jgi:DNA-binding transcriptional regulator LsrR (DeoR family)